MEDDDGITRVTQLDGSPAAAARPTVVSNGRAAREMPSPPPPRASVDFADLVYLGVGRSPSTPLPHPHSPAAHSAMGDPYYYSNRSRRTSNMSNNTFLSD